MVMGSRSLSRRRASGGRFSRGSRRGFEWEPVSVIGTGVTAITSAAEILTAAEIDELSQSATLVRLRGMLLANFNTVGSNAALWFGIALVPATVTAIEMPNALADGNWNGWLWHQSIPFITAAAIGTDTRDSTQASCRVLIDNRGKRRLQEQTHLMFVSSKVGAVSSFTFHASMRIGIQLARR